jgi:putative toxin-antitoxin system antitoxin component (TIGR02293 family)
MSAMSIADEKIRGRKEAQPIVGILENSIANKSPSNIITWLLLGGTSFMANQPVTSLDFITASEKGIPKQSVINLAEVLNVPMKHMANLLNISYKTLGRKRKTDAMNSIVSSLSIEIANTVAKGLAVFEDADKFNRWLNKENRALNGQKPFDLLNTPTGIKLVNQILGRIEEGVYT